MSVTLAMADNADGGGFVATITGSGGGVIGLVRFDPAENVAYSAGVRSGNGTISGTTTPGVYWWWAIELATAVSNVLPKAITRSTTAIYDLCLEAIKQTINLNIVSGDIPGLVGVARQRKLRLDSLSECLPCAVVLPSNPSMEPVTNERDQLTYPCQVIIVDQESPQADDDDTANTPYHLINERIRRLFSQQRLAGVTSVDVCRVQLGNHFEWLNNGYDLVQSVILVNCLTREPRGV